MCVSVCMTGIHASKRRKEVVCLEGDENICDFSLGSLDKQLVCRSAHVSFWPPPRSRSLFANPAGEKQHTLIL